MFLMFFLLLDSSALSFTLFLVMNVMQTQVTIAWESEKGDITSLAASKGQVSLVFFTHLIGPRWTRSTFSSRSRLLCSQALLVSCSLLVRLWRLGIQWSARLEEPPRALVVRVCSSSQSTELAHPVYDEYLVCSSLSRLLAAHGMHKCCIVPPSSSALLVRSE